MSENSLGHSSLLHMQTCNICEDLIEEQDVFLTCSTCHMHMHCVCWDLDAPVQVCEYLVNSLNNTCIRLFSPYCAADNHSSDIMRKLENRIRSLETKIADVDVSTCHSHPARKSNASVAACNTRPALPTNNRPHDNSIQSEVAETIDREQYKCNVIFCNMTVNGSNDVTKVESLLVHMTGKQPPPFHCRRIGKVITGKSRSIIPLLI